MVKPSETGTPDRARQRPVALTCAGFSTIWQASLAVIADFSPLSAAAVCPDQRPLMPARRVSLLVSAFSAIGLALAGCAAPGGGSGSASGQTAEAADVEFNDPLEDLNRKIFGFNQTVDEVVLVPV